MRAGEIDAAFGRAICWAPARLIAGPHMSLAGERPCFLPDRAVLPFGVSQLSDTSPRDFNLPSTGADLNRRVLRNASLPVPSSPPSRRGFFVPSVVF